MSGRADGGWMEGGGLLGKNELGSCWRSFLTMKEAFSFSWWPHRTAGARGFQEVSRLHAAFRRVSGTVTLHIRYPSSTVRNGHGGMTLPVPQSPRYRSPSTFWHGSRFSWTRADAATG